MSEDTEALVVPSDAQEVATQKPWEPMGPIHISGEVQGSYTHCAMKEFDDAAAVEAFFREQTNCVVTHMLVRADKLVVVFTRQLTREELEDIRAWDQERKAFFDRRAQERAAAQAETRAAEKAAADEAKRLRNLGEHCEKNHGALRKKEKSNAD